MPNLLVSGEAFSWPLCSSWVRTAVLIRYLSIRGERVGLYLISTVQGKHGMKKNMPQALQKPWKLAICLARNLPSFATNEVAKPRFRRNSTPHTSFSGEEAAALVAEEAAAAARCVEEEPLEVWVAGLPNFVT